MFVVYVVLLAMYFYQQVGVFLVVVVVLLVITFYGLLFFSCWLCFFHEEVVVMLFTSCKYNSLYIKKLLCGVDVAVWINEMLSCMLLLYNYYVSLYVCCCIHQQFCFLVISSFTNVVVSFCFASQNKLDTLSPIMW